MKRQFGKLSKAEQEKVESKYHHMNPKDFAEGMNRAKKVRPAVRPKSKNRAAASEKKRAA